MSNAMRMGKRTLAGVAAGALGLALIPFVSATSASAVSGAATTTPVRVTYTGSVQDAVEPAVMTMPSASSWTPAANFKFDLTTAPPGGYVTVGDANKDDSIVRLAGDDTLVTIFDDTLTIAANVAGTYIGQIANGVDTATFNITTTGAPASLELTPASATVPEGGSAEFTVTIKDASGNVTQPTTLDTVTLTASGNGTPASTTLAGTGSLSDGSVATSITLSSGTSTITATPAGTLPSYGLTAQTATLTASGTIQSTGVKGMAVTSPATAVARGVLPAWTPMVPAGTTSLTIEVDDDSGATSTAGNTLRFKVTASAGAVNGTAYTTPIYVEATVGSDEKATIDLTLGAGAQVAGENVKVEQVTAANSTTLSDGTSRSITVYQLTPTVLDAGLTASPTGTVVAKVGAAVSITASVDDSFGSPQSGWTVTAYRSSTVSAGAFVSSGVTNASGEASLSLTPLSTTAAGSSETYYLQATSATGQNVPSSSAKSVLTVNYTDSGDVTTLTVNPTPAAATDCSNTSCDILVVPLVSAPTNGTVFESGAAASTSYYTIATSTPTAATTSNWAEFALSTTPANAVEVSTPEGVYVSSTVPSATNLIAWNAGTSTATISSGSSAYVWGTKTGLHDVTFTSGTVTVTAKVFIANDSADAYNIALSPTTQSLAAGGIGTVTLSVTDVFGNPVAASSKDDTGGVSITASGEILLGGFLATGTYATGADGTATVTIIAGNAAGTGSLAATPAGGASTVTPAWKSTYTPPTGAPAPVASAAATVTVSGGSTATSIIITGERGTVRGKAGIIVDGLTQGLVGGTIVVPFIKFPGQTSYTQGDAQRAVVIFDDNEVLGEFSWQRRTGKKTYVYFATEDGTTRSSRIIIPAK